LNNGEYRLILYKTRNPSKGPLPHHAKGFKTANIASQWFDTKTTPPLSISFAPHKTAFSLDKLADAVEHAKSSVLFAVMEMSGSGRALADLKNLSNNPNLFSLGTIESKSDLQLFKPGTNNVVTSFSYLAKNIPDPFKAEWSGGAGQVIHHKFIVCDFNTANPVVFCGSSNLAEGGETSNGDNLLAIYDSKIAIEYAVEAIRIFDHYRFRSLQQSSTTSKPLALSTNQDWIKPYYDPKNIKYLERKLLSQT
jgi:phosphatidylserine/phosphatidylglycerophosphate/cardiolipin synthase-like enzyme